MHSEAFPSREKCKWKKEEVAFPMKRIISLLLALALVLSLAPAALAETTINAKEKRGIKLQKVGENEVEDGISPTTGLPLDEMDAPEGFAGLAVTGRYLPMMVQIDNSEGGVGSIAPWGASYADVVYETPLHSKGFTRISYIFSDLIPDSVGPVRSTRVGHAWIREEWDAGFLFYGSQEYAKTSVKAVFKETGANKKGVIFSGTDGANKAHKQYYSTRKGIASPHNKDANVAAISELVPEDHVAPNHAYLFTDDLPEGDDAETVIINWEAIYYGSNLVYDADSNTYFRYMRYKDDELIPYEDRDSQEQLSFANVIIQFAETDWVRSDAPITHVVGEGNADFFMGGKHVAGYWKRADMSSRTVFYGPDGNEMPMQRGKTLIVIIPPDKTVSYE